MKTCSSIFAGKCFLFALISLLYLGLASTTRTDAQTVTAVKLSSVDSSVPVAAGYATAEFGAYAFPVLSPLQVRVIFENRTACQVWVSVQDTKGDVLYQKAYKHTPKYNSLLDFSNFPDGEYRVQVRAATRGMGQTRHLYEQAFQVRSQTDRTLTVTGKNLKKELYTKRTFLSGK